MTDRHDTPSDDPGAPTEPDGGIRERLSSRGEDALGDVAQILLDNPLLGQALQVAFGARDAATQATSRTMKGLNVASQGDVERLGRRLRSLSDRLEAVEDRLDALTREADRARGPSQPNP